jgi:malic enzyme
MATESTEQKNLAAAALEYHAFPTAGKIAVVPTKGLTNQRDLGLAFRRALPLPAMRSWLIRAKSIV